MSEMLTVEDFTIDKSEAKYGPVWIVTPKADTGKHYVLRSDIWLVDFHDFHGKSRSPLVHIDLYYGEDLATKVYSSWYGAFQTVDMDEAVANLIAGLNRNARLDRIERGIEQAAMELTDAIGDIDRAVANFSRLEIDDVMDRISGAYANLMIKYAEVREVP